jgi:hypothetical protein
VGLRQGLRVTGVRGRRHVEGIPDVTTGLALTGVPTLGSVLPAWAAGDDVALRHRLTWAEVGRRCGFGKR